MSKIKYVPFRKTRIKWFVFKNKYNSIQSKKANNEQLHLAYESLFKLGVLALLAIKVKDEQRFLKLIDDLHNIVEDPDIELKGMQDGTGKDVPPWLKK